MPQPPAGDVRPGDAPSAADRNRLLASLRDAASLRGGPGISARDSRGGRSLAGRPEGEHARIKLTGSFSSGYPWKEVVRAGGAWVDTGRVGSSTADPAFELNDDAALVASGTVYPARRAAGGDWVFWKGVSGGGIDPDPACHCWTEGTAPGSLSWTYVAKRQDGLGGFVTLGTTSGTLSWTPDVQFGSAPCGIPGGGGAAAGWIGEFTYYTTGALSPDDEITSVLVPHCSTIKMDGQAFVSQHCRWLAVLCEPAVHGNPSPPSRLLLLYTIAGPPETCQYLDLFGYSNPDFYSVGSNSGVDSATDDCDPFLLQVTYFDGSVLTITA